MEQEYDHNFKILLIGPPAVGKTSLVNKYVHGKFRQDYISTIGMEPYTKYETVNDVQICYSIFDIAGQQQFNRLREIFFKGSKGALAVFDLTRSDTFTEISQWLEDAKMVEPDQLFILVGNKSDLKDEREIQEDQGVQFAKDNNCLAYIETSAKTGNHVNTAFNSLGENILAGISTA